MAGGEILFCPFCRESFEGEKRCPAHELELVRFERLGPDPEEPQSAPEVIDHTPVPVFSLGYGRGLIALGAALNALALLAEMVQGVGDGRGLAGFELAVSMPTLWTPLAVSFVVLYILRTRRTPARMRSLRVLVPALALVAPLSVAWAFGRLMAGAPVYEAGSRLIGPAPSLGVYVFALASVCLFVGGLRFGCPPRR